MTYKERQTNLIRRTAAQQTDNKHISYPKAILYAFFRFYQYFCDSVKEILTALYNYGKQKDTITGECPQGAEAGRGVSAAAVSTEELP